MSTIVEVLEGPKTIHAEPCDALATVTGNSASRIHASWNKVVRRTQMLAMSVAVWLLYTPHYTVLRLLGPRYGMIWVRLAARLHFWLTAFGAQRSTRKRLAQMHQLFNTKHSVSTILRKHLEMKHECFARVRVFNLHGAASDGNDVWWEVNRDCLPLQKRIEHRERGLMIVGFHFGFYQMSATGFSQHVPSCKPVQLRYPHSACAESTANRVARMAIRKALEADRKSGVSFIYIDGKKSLLSVIRLLRQLGCVAVAADGGLGDEFVEVPFFDGTLRVPCGWARLAAITKSEVLVLCDRPIDRRRREGLLFDVVRCEDDSREAIYRSVAGAIQLLERLIREEPWSWHPWQRLACEKDANGTPHYYLKQFSLNASQDREAAQSPSATINGRPRSHRVAVISNSLTPYRIQLHERIVREVPQVELWSLATHQNGFERWSTVKAPAPIRPVEFGPEQPTNQQTQLRFALREWRKAGQIIRWLQTFQVDTVLCQGCGDAGRLRIIRWCSRRKIPCFLTGDFNVCSDNLRGLRRIAKRCVYGAAVKWSTGLMPCGTHGRALLDRYGGAKKPVFTFPFMPDVSLFERTPLDAVNSIGERYLLDASRRRIVFSGRMTTVKRPDLAIQAFSAIAAERPEWDLVMLGKGALRARLEASVPRQLRNRVHWLGFLDRTQDVAGLYSQCDVLLLPSDHEPWGVVIVEAAAAGLAIVASDVVGSGPELVQGGRNGALFPAGNISQLVAALRHVTAADHIDELKQQSPAVLREWLACADPVAGFRAALTSIRAFDGQSGGCESVA